MSRLDSFIRRLTAQRTCLDLAAALVRDLPGPVLELGLGNGRTFDHLRELLPGRAIFVFDREVKAHPASTPDPARLILGDIQDTLPAAGARLPGPAALVHSDLGTGDAARNARLAAWLAGALPPLLADGAVVICDQTLDDPRLVPLPPPDGVAPGRYFLYRHRAGSTSG
ncbi:MAG TPA: class I SAM-dependent methyltransferase [Geminicoccaceae bacterium]|nr:class I SAM-dependent methyltransferase [Geminicoccaceae bacterium]